VNLAAWFYVVESDGGMAKVNGGGERTREDEPKSTVIWLMAD